MRETLTRKFAVRTRPVLSPFSMAISMFRLVPVALAAVLMVGGGFVASASQKALPGEMLYGTKLFTERVGQSLAFKRSTKIHLAGEYASRRIREATKMLSTGALDTETEKQLAVNMQQHLALVTTYTNDAGSHEELSEAAQVVGKVVGYTNVLSQVGALEGTQDRSSDMGEVAEAFVSAHEKQMTDDLSALSDADSSAILQSSASSILGESSDPLIQATIASIMTTEDVRVGGSSDRGGSILHALADMAESQATLVAYDTGAES